MSSWERKIIEFFEKNLTLIAACIMILLSLYAKKQVLGYMSPDYLTNFLEVEGNVHTAPYMMLIQLMSLLPWQPIVLMKVGIAVLDVVFAAYLAWGAMCLHMFQADQPNSKRSGIRWLVVFAVLLASPIVFENGVLWNHLDVAAVMCIMLAGISIFHDRRQIAYIWLGVGLAFQFQYILVLPIAIWFVYHNTEKKRTKAIAEMAGITGLVMILFSIPALFVGYSPLQILTSYGRCFGQIVGNQNQALNFQRLFGMSNRVIMVLGIVMYLLLIGMFFYQRRNQKWKAIDWIIGGIWVWLTGYFFLPGMLNYYSFFPVMLLILLVASTDRFCLPMAILQCTAFLEYGQALRGEELFPDWLLTLFMLFGYLLFSWQVLSFRGNALSPKGQE